MITKFLVRGMLTGIAAGVIAFGFAKVFGEPEVDKAIAFESRMDQLEGKPVEPVLVSRAVQSGLGLFTGITVYGTALGGLFALAFAVAYGRTGSLQPRSLAAIIAAVGFVAIVLVPALKYPPNPPSIGEPETIRMRTATYFSMILLSLAALSLALAVGRRLSVRLGTWNATLLGAVVFIGVVTASMLLLPRINEVPAAFSADLLWQFRIASLGTQTVLWLTLGLLFGGVTQRSLRTA